VNGSARVATFVQQLVYTASEEPGIARVLITQNSGRTAIIGGEGLVIDRPATRADLTGR
jgi:spore germination protein GerM